MIPYGIMGIASIAVDPTNKNNIYLGTSGDPYNLFHVSSLGLGWQIGGAGILKSFDGGVTWQTENIIINDPLERVQRIYITPDGTRLYATENRIYYIARHINEIGQPTRVHGFIRTNAIWGTVSPAYIAQGLYGQNVNSVQPDAKGQLLYRDDRLYFRDKYGLIRFYNIYNDWNYWYNSFAGANILLLQQNIRIAGQFAIYDNRIYYVAIELSNSRKSIHCIIEGNNGFSTVSPTWSAAWYGYQQPIGVQFQGQPAGQIAVSPDGKIIAYTDFLGNVFYYTDPDNTGWNYQYKVMPGPGQIKNSLQFRNNEELFGILPALHSYPNASAAYFHGRVYYLKWERDYCKGPVIDAIEQRHILV